MESLMEKLPMILGIALCLSEALAYIPSLKSNSLLQFISSGLKKAKSFMDKMKEQKPDAE